MLSSNVVDMSAVIWTIKWPKNGTTATFIGHVTEWVLEQLEDADMYLVFDRYYEYSV